MNQVICPDCGTPMNPAEGCYRCAMMKVFVSQTITNLENDLAEGKPWGPREFKIDEPRRNRPTTG